MATRSESNADASPPSEEADAKEGEGAVNDAEDAGKRTTKRPKKRRRWRRWLVGFGIGTPVAIVALWIAVHRVEWLGPLIADSLRAVIGVKNVTRLEDFAYGIEDRWNRFWRSDEKPKAYWDVPPESSAAPAPAPSDGDAGPPPLPPFRPKDVGPMHKSWSAPGDGVWVPMRDHRHPGEDPFLYKTLIHPDRNRSWAELFVVAVDLRRVNLHAMPGKYEPKSFEKEGVLYKPKRTGKIAPEHRGSVLAAFNGGFKTEHGWFGMHFDGVTLVKARKNACSVALYNNGAVRVASWKEIAETESEMVWWRQTPGCMYERGQMHVGLTMEMNTAWGATLDGETVIRRSAIGMSRDRQTLYVGITNSTTARAIAKGMRFAGAFDVAQLDVNWSYPKFVTYEPGDAGGLMAVPLAKGFEFKPGEYLDAMSHRDFFYLTPKKREDFFDKVPAPPLPKLPEPESDADAGAKAPEKPTKTPGGADGGAKAKPAESG